MRRLKLIPGLVSIILAGIIFIFGSGLKVFYSGGFFLLLGIILLLNARKEVKKQ
jgi:hypothetical protein